MQQGKFCIDCKHIKKRSVLDRFFGAKIEFSKCAHPDIEKRHPVTGKSDFVYCSVAREFNSYNCGKDGKLFEAKV
jgi:hypothetical protein